MASTSHPHRQKFTLTSTTTALALLLPPNLSPELTTLRTLHDRTSQTWPSHLTILYPFLPLSSLPSAMPLLQSALSSLPYHKLKVVLDEVGVFKHRKNATVYLRPGEGGESEGTLKELRGCVEGLFGLREGEGTREGVWRPHLGVGQAARGGNGVERLVEQVSKLDDLEWDAKGLVVLRREVDGRMTVCEELRFGGNSELDEDGGNVKEEGRIDDTGWTPCFAFKNDGYSIEQETWSRFSPDSKLEAKHTENISISTYNIMAEPTAAPFTTRLPLIITSLSSPSPLPPSSTLQILCLQEINDESLPLILASPYICNTYPYSTHAPSSLLPSARNLLTLASQPFTSTVVNFEERHKSALVVEFEMRFGGERRKLLVANVHLTSGLTDRAVRAKKSQMDNLRNFLLARDNGRESEIVLAGDFNLTTSKRTIETTLSRGLITAETANAVKNVVDLSVWEDAFLASELIVGGGCENTLLGHGGGEIFEGEKGATFDRTTNPIAAQLDPPIDRSPQRYDRVLYLKSGGISSEKTGFEIFGFADDQGHVGSDHYGVCALLSIANTGSGSGLGSGADIGPSTTKHRDLSRPEAGETITIVEDDTDFSTLLDPYLPTANDIAQRRMAIELLQSTLSRGPGLENLILAPLGSYLMGTYFADSDVDILAIGSVSPAKFFDFVGRELRKSDLEGDTGSGDSFKGVHFVNSLVSIVEVVVLGIKFDLQYCQADELVKVYYDSIPSPELQDLVFDKDLISTLSPSSIRPLNTYRDSAFLLNTIPHLPSYRLAHRYLSIYLKNRGLYSAKFGYLGGIHLQLMLNRVVKLIHLSTTSDNYESGSVPVTVSASTVIRTFFACYSSFNWASENVLDPLLGPECKISSRSARDAIFIPAIHTPTARPNVASSCTKLSAHTLSSEFKLAADHLSAGDWEWCLRSPEEGLGDFLHGSGAFIRVAIDVWGVGEGSGRGKSVIAEEKVRGVIGALESRFPRLLVSLGWIAGVEGRVWPARLYVPDRCQSTQDEGKGKGREYEDYEARDHAEGQFKGYYLLGVSTREGMDKEGKRLMGGKLMTAVREFERGILEVREFVEASENVWVVVDVVRRKEVLGMGLEIDRREWGVKTRQRPDTLEHQISLQDPESGFPSSTATSSAGTHSSSSAATTTAVKSSKQLKQKATPLRPVHEIIARIKWDADLDIANYLIGYEDRFVGVKEMELGRWKSESTDEEFIPLHGVVWIRMKDAVEDGTGERVDDEIVSENECGDEDERGRDGDGDEIQGTRGAIVWDRRRKIDRFFGSGIGVG
ncbi:hypothetical protein ONS96_002670 [Cadophora gregata f. sp. sojae]|nr:hypothetical protein ONS96_002670 [Cadophora gregata f. sp. sojae]